MARSSRPVHATTQIIDTGSNNPGHVYTAGQANGISVNGTIWNLLPNTAMRIFNVSVRAFPFPPTPHFKIQNINVFVLLLDQFGNAIFQDSGGDSLGITLASENYTDPAFVGSLNGFSLSAVGDPLVEIVSNALGAGFANPPVIAGAQLSANVDATNTDAANSQTLFVLFDALISFVPRELTLR